MKMKMMIMAGLVAASSMWGAEIPQALQGKYYGEYSSKENNCIKGKGDPDLYNPLTIDKKKMYDQRGGMNCDFKKVISAKNNKYKLRFACENVMDGGKQVSDETFTILKDGFVMNNSDKFYSCK